MLQELFREDAYLQSCEATIAKIDELGIVLDRTVFYPTEVGQSGDIGFLQTTDGQQIRIADTRKAETEILHKRQAKSPH